MVGEAGDVFVFLDGTFYIILVILAIKSLKFMDMKIKKVFLLYFLAFTVVFSIGTTNYGTAMRHRHKILWLIVAVGVMPKRQLIVKN
jgi:predicted membrane channel-forming protein YqfA (hemolysin III family)